MKMKAIGASVLLACVMVLALTNKVTGAQAIQAIEALGAAWFGATALLGSAHLISNAMVVKKSSNVICASCEAALTKPVSSQETP